MPDTVLDGAKFKGLFIAGSRRLEESREYLNSINVFPVPDADTGANMAGTMSAAVDALHELEDATLKNVLETIALRLRMEARGNSGVILSEFFHGMFSRIKGEEHITPESFVEAIESGKRAAYAAIADPREGTILTVISHAVESLNTVKAEIENMTHALERMVESQRSALERTKDMMPLLRENNVVDSGAHGFLLFWEGALAYMKNEIDHAILKPVQRVFKAEQAEKIKFRYCTEVLARGVTAERARLVERLAAMGDSLIVTGDRELLKVHVHTNEPEALFAYMKTLGEIIKTKADDMREQHARKAETALHQKTRVMVDSTADLDHALLEEWEIEMAPLQVIIGEESFRDRVELSADEFYSRLAHGGPLPRTSLPKGSDFVAAYERMAPHCDAILGIFISSQLSGTWQAGKKWGDEFSPGKVTAYDSNTASLGAGLMALEAARMAREGAAVEAIAARLDGIKGKLRVYFSVDTLEFLAKNGRIGAAKRFIGETLGLKPVLTCVRGQVAPFSKAFGKKRTISKLLDIAARDEARAGFEGVYAVAWSNNPDERERLIEQMNKRLTVNKLVVGQISPVIGAHTGPGALGIISY